MENHNRVPRSLDPNYHISHDLADHAISWMQREKEIDPARPFFLYIAPSATHAPHMAPKEWIDKFKGQFDIGRDRYREMTLERQKKFGVVPPLQWTKQVASHFGGTRNPMIVSWPAKIKDKGGVRTQFHHVTDIMPTILEVANIQAPDVLNGTPQKPIEGVSMVYTFNDAKAPDRRKMQIFELVANRGMYQDRWMASSLSFIPWEPVRTGFDPDKAKWELYHIDQDFSQADDLAAKNLDKQKALVDLWWAEAAREDILPLDWRAVERLSDQLTGRPSVAAGRSTFVYGTPLVALPEASAPDLKNKSFTITAEAEVPADGGDGMIFTQGGITAGWGFYLQKGKLVGIHNYIGMERYRVVSTDSVPTGKVTLAFDFKYDGGGMGKGGAITLLANGKKIGGGRVEKTAPIKYSLYEGQDIGEDNGSPVDFTYKPPFKFAGKIEKVTVELK